MGKNIRSYESHDFYCLNCGRKGIPCYRKKGHQHQSGHYKKLYCAFCFAEVNHFECKTQEDVELFKEAFEKGEFKNEAEESLCHVRNCWIG